MRRVAGDCQNFIDCQGREACVLLMTGDGKKNPLRGIPVCAIRGAMVVVGDTVRKTG